jgi:Polyketide cyclase / dehydrase and lipid transport.
MSERADIVDTGHKYRRAGRIVINAPAQVIFDIIADPYRHPEFDGSGTVKKGSAGPHRLSKGATFGMDMKMGLPYKIKNTVEEFDEPTQIAWRHAGQHRWALRTAADRRELHRGDRDVRRFDGPVPAGL